MNYKYYLFKNKVARLNNNEFETKPKEFYINGQWLIDKELNTNLNDAIMDYGNYSWNAFSSLISS